MEEERSSLLNEVDDEECWSIESVIIGSDNDEGGSKIDVLLILPKQVGLT